MKLLVVSPFVVYPGVPHGGGALCWGQLEGLAEKHEVHFLAFAQDGSAELTAALPHLERICASVTTVHQPLGKLTILRAKVAQLALKPVGASICNVAAMHSALLQLKKNMRPDAVLMQFPQMAQYVKDATDLPTLMDVQDAYSVSSFRQFKSTRGWLKRIQAFLNWLGWLRYEAKWYPRFTAVAAITEQDRLGLEVFSPGLGATTSPAAVGLPDLKWAPSDSKRVAFIGSFTHLPNVAALRFFLDSVWPLVLQAHPDAVFEVAGKGVPADLKVRAGKNLVFAGVVPDAYAFVRSAAVVVVPVLSGGGIKIKTLEAMATGCPIVATSIGAEETGAISGEHMLIADTPIAFAMHINSLLSDPVQSQRLGSNAKALIAKRFSWQAKWASLNGLLDASVSKHQQAAVQDKGTQQ
ncbi:glycosyltransferase [Rhodoferax bucti]|uniref:glycosyltransferase n=1 Tax=Rhodoferax bucti TaxID=2576305 RepID=UPI001107B971|nr:glycosyltransferase family 4 protein [Rhodoferax bucti]